MGIVYENIDNTSSPLPGVNVFWAGTTIGTSTDATGKFEILKMAKDSSALVVTYVTYKPDTIWVKKSDNNIEIILKENRELEEITVTVRSRGTEFDNLSAILSQNILSKELKKAACCNLSESFETNASVDVSYGDAVTGAKQIKLLGLAGKYSQILTENIPNLRGLASAFGIYYVPGPWMQSIQISKGSASVINGYESTTGQINIEFKNPNQSEKYYVDYFLSSSLKNDVNFITSTNITENLSTTLLLHGEYMAYNVDHNNDSFLDHPNIRQMNVLNKWDYTGLKNWHIAATISYLREDRYGGQMGFGDADKTNKYRNIIQTNRFQFWSKVGYIFDNELNSSFGFINMLTLHNQDASFGVRNFDSDEFSTYTNLTFETNLFNNKHKLNAGLSLVFDHFDETFGDAAIKKDELTPGAFMQYTFQPLDNVTLIGGIRADNNSKYGTFITPRAHLRYGPFPNTTLRFSFGKGYRSSHVIQENISLLSSARKFKIQDNLDLEEATNFGINATQYFHIFDREMVINAEFYRTNFMNKIVVDIDQNINEVNFYNLAGKSYANNFQIEMNYELIPRLDLLAAIRYSDVKTTFNNELKSKPLHKKTKGIISLSYLSKFKLWQYDLTTQFNGKSRIPKYFGKNYDSYSPNFINIMAQVTRYFKNWEVFVGVENLTNYTQSKSIISADDPFGENYDSSIIWGPLEGRKFYLGIRLSIK